MFSFILRIIAAVNLRRISFSYPINVKYDCLAFREDMLLTHSTMNDLFHSKNNSLKSRISVTPTFQRLIKAIRISPGFPGLLLTIEYILASNSFYSREHFSCINMRSFVR